MAAKKFEDRVFELLDRGQDAVSSVQRALSCEGWREAADLATLTETLIRIGLTVQNDRISL